MDKILILGVNGFTGTHFQDYIKKNSLSEKFLFAGAGREGICLPNMSFSKIDLLNYEHLEKLIIKEHPQYIINLAGTFNCNDFDLMLQINANISRNICETIIKNKIPVKKILFVGSAAEYGHPGHLPITENDAAEPVNFYGLTKLIQTQYVQFYFNNFRLNVNIARTFNVLGKNLPQSLSIGSFIHQIKSAKDGDDIYVGNINAKRDFLNIEDVIDAYWNILLKGKSGDVYNVCSGRSYSIKEILDFLIEKSGKRLQVSVEDKRIKKYDIMDIYGDNSKLKKDTGWKQKIDILDSLSKLIS